eukprot:4260444-Amphidinium_carterae.2
MCVGDLGGAMGLGLETSSIIESGWTWPIHAGMPAFCGRSLPIRLEYPNDCIVCKYIPELGSRHCVFWSSVQSRLASWSSGSPCKMHNYVANQLYEQCVMKILTCTRGQLQESLDCNSRLRLRNGPSWWSRPRIVFGLGLPFGGLDTVVPCCALLADAQAALTCKCQKFIINALLTRLLVGQGEALCTGHRPSKLKGSSPHVCVGVWSCAVAAIVQKSK